MKVKHAKLKAPRSVSTPRVATTGKKTPAPARRQSADVMAVAKAGARAPKLAPRLDKFLGSLPPKLRTDLQAQLATEFEGVVAWLQTALQRQFTVNPSFRPGVDKLYTEANQLDHDLTRAAMTGPLSQVKRWIAAGALLGPQPGDGYNWGALAVREAIIGGHEHIARYLVEHGVDPARDGDANAGNALVTLIRKTDQDDAALASFLLAHGDFDSSKGHDRRLGLDEATSFARPGHPKPKIMQAILESGRATQGEIATALGMAAQAHSPSEVTLLAKYLTKPRPSGNGSHAFLTTAIPVDRYTPERIKAATETVKALLQAGMDPNDQGPFGGSALSRAQGGLPHTQAIVTLLRQHGARPDAGR